MRPLLAWGRQVDVFRLPGAPHTPVFTGHTVLKVSIGTAT